MIWCAFPTACSKIMIETLINTILHKTHSETHMEVTDRTVEHRDHLAQALSSKQGQRWLAAVTLAQSHPEHLQGMKSPISFR